MEINSSFKADSLRLRIPMTDLPKGIFKNSPMKKVSKRYIASYNYNEADFLQVNAKTGEISSALMEIPNSEKMLNSIELSNDGGITKVAIFIENSNISGRGLCECASFTINAKQLKEKYFEGLNGNIDVIADYISTATDKHGNRYEIPAETLNNGYVTDLDVCQDYTMTTKEFEKSLIVMTERAKPSKLQNKGYYLFNNKINQGIMFSDRASATPTNELLKYYNKRMDILSELHSYFFETYFNYNELNTPNIVRAEFTLKNKKHFNYHKLASTQLKDVIGINEERWQSIYNKILSNHFDKRTRPQTIESYEIINNVYRFARDIASGAINLDLNNINLYLNYYINIGASTATRKRNAKKIETAQQIIEKSIYSNATNFDAYTKMLDF